MSNHFKYSVMESLSFLSVLLAMGTSRAALRDPEEQGSMFKGMTQGVESEPEF